MLVDWFRSEVEIELVNQFFVRPVEIERDIAFGALSDLFNRVEERWIDQLAPAYLEVIMTLASGSYVDDHNLIRAATSSLFRSVAEAGKTVLILDDAQWVDAQSAEVIAFACRRSLLGASVLASFRLPTSTMLMNAILRETGTTSLELGELSSTELTEIVAREAPTITPTLALSLADLAQGNPLRAREIGRAARRGTHALFQQRNVTVQNNPLASATERLSAEQRDVLYAVTHIRGHSVDIANVMFGRDVSNNVLTTATDDGYITIENGRVCLDHPLLGDALASAVPGERQRQIHALAATVVDEPIERARQLSLSTVDFTLGQRIEMFLSARLAERQGSLALALQLAHRASDGFALPSAEDDVLRRAYVDSQRYVANLEFRIDDPGAAERRLTTLAMMLDGDPRQPRVEIDLANLISWSRSLDQGVPRYEAVLRRADLSDELRAEAAMQLAMLHLNVGSIVDAVATSTEGAQVGQRAGGQVGAESASISVVSRFLAGEGVDTSLMAVASAAESTDEWLSVQCPPFSLFPFMLGWCEDPSSLDAFARRRSIFHTRSSATAFAMGAAFETNLLCSRGRVYDARTLVQTTLDMAEFDNPLTAALASLAAARLQAHLGDASTSRFLLGQVEAEFATRRFRLGTTEAASIRVALAASEGDLAEVLRLASQWIETLDQLGMHEPMIIPGILDLIEAIGATQNQPLAVLLRRKLDGNTVAHRDDVSAARLWLEASLLAGAKNDAQQAADLFQRLSVLWSQTGRWFWYARVQLSLGRLVRREGARRAAVEYFETALKHFSEMESSPWVDITNAELLRSGRLAKADGRALSTIEAEVARFAAAGRSNKEIAQSMFVSEKTIEAHLSSTYRKLGISRRTQLNAALNQN